MANFQNIFNINDNVISNISTTLLSPRAEFLKMLSDWSTTISLDFLWAITFDIPNLLKDDQMQYWNENITNGKTWGINNAVSKLITVNDSKITGLLMCQSVDIPQEEVNVAYAGINNRGFKYTPYIQKRVEPQIFSIKFIEQNVSITNNLIRPWVILASHLGLVARDNGDNSNSIKTDLTIYELAKTGNPNGELFIRQNWLFKNCIPKRVSAETKTFSDSKISTRNSEWVYTQYQLISNQS